MMRFIPSASNKPNVLHWIVRAMNSEGSYHSYYNYMKCYDIISIDVLYQWRNTMNDETEDTGAEATLLSVPQDEGHGPLEVEGEQLRHHDIGEGTAPSEDEHVSVPGYNYIAIEAF